MYNVFLTLNDLYSETWILWVNVINVYKKSYMYYMTFKAMFLFWIQDMDVWVTAIVIAFFRKEFAQQKAEWNMIEEKALQWLKTKDLEGKDVIQEASGFLLSWFIYYDEHFYA